MSIFGKPLYRWLNYIFSMLEADFTTGAILISFGAVLGVASPVQLLLMILFEVIFYNVSGKTPSVQK